MIALPNYMLSDKIATPNKAGTLKGVSPISSTRNVMVKVKDTASFIEAARAIHGDKYDYSLTVYSGSQKPITIICKKCGPFVLAEAGTHYWKKACGCRFCEIDAMLHRKGAARHCSVCSKRMKYEPHLAKKHLMCSDCMASEDGVQKLAWIKWCKVTSNRTFREQRNKLGRSKWVVFADQKVSNISYRSRLIPSQKQIKEVREKTWTQWLSRQMQSKFRTPESPWQVKARRWARSLEKRSRTRPAERKS